MGPLIHYVTRSIFERRGRVTRQRNIPPWGARINRVRTSGGTEQAVYLLADKGVQLVVKEVLH